MSVSGFPTRTLYGATAAVSLRRLVNDEILYTASRFDEGSTAFEFLCECGDLRCREYVKMTRAAYAKTAAGSVVGHD